ncbi:hypothetical protein MMC25_007758 [Agyrium rufum]|nr:hypothetical protein [Agyrium rufum]
MCFRTYIRLLKCIDHPACSNATGNIEDDLISLEQDGPTMNCHRVMLDGLVSRIASKGVGRYVFCDTVTDMTKTALVACAGCYIDEAEDRLKAIPEIKDVLLKARAKYEREERAIATRVGRVRRSNIGSLKQGEERALAAIMAPFQPNTSTSPMQAGESGPVASGTYTRSTLHGLSKQQGRKESAASVANTQSPTPGPSKQRKEKRPAASKTHTQNLKPSSSKQQKEGDTSSGTKRPRQDAEYYGH